MGFESKNGSSSEAQTSVWGPYPNYDDVARFEYGRRMWQYPGMRERLLLHWLDERHPYRHRFIEHRFLLEEILTSDLPILELDRRLRSRGSSLRCMVREIPPIFGGFFPPANR